jgi:hypothetical protein
MRIAAPSRKGHFKQGLESCLHEARDILRTAAMRYSIFHEISKMEI